MLVSDPAVPIAESDRTFRLGPVTGLAMSRVAASAISGLWFVVAARELSLNDFGDLATVLALVAIAVTINDAGLQIVLMDHVGRRGVFDAEVARRVVGRRLVYAAACALVLVPFYLGATDGGSIAVPLIAAGSLLGTAVYPSWALKYSVQ